MLGVDPTRTLFPENREGPILPLYAYLYVADREEGLVITTAASLLDGNPRNNVIERAVTFNPEERLRGARAITVAGRFAYIGCDRGLAVVDLNDPTKPSLVAEMEVQGVRGIAIQFRYAFVACAEGLVAIDITPNADGSFPGQPRIVSRVSVPDARQLYVARTYAYVAAGKSGLTIVDGKRPAAMALLETYDAGGQIDDCNDVKVGITNTSLFAYLADGRNGLRVLQLTSPETTPDIYVNRKPIWSRRRPQPTALTCSILPMSWPWPFMPKCCWISRNGTRPWNMRPRPSSGEGI